MGTISILLGTISFFAFVYGGARVSIALVEAKSVLALSLSSLENISNTTLTIFVVGIFTFVGLLVGMNLIMHGLTYNKVAKMQNHMRRRG